MNIIRLEEKLRRDIPGGTDSFYKEWADYIHDIADQIIEPEIIEHETCSGCPADDIQVELETLQMNPVILVPKYSA